MTGIGAVRARRRVTGLAMITLVASGCGELITEQIGPASGVGTVVYVGIPIHGPHTGGILTVDDTRVGCAYTLFVRSDAEVTHRRGVISLGDVVPGDVVTVWTTEPPACEGPGTATRVRVTGTAQPQGS